jgi:serine/threonine protein kinase
MIIANKYKILEKIGEGKFGKVYKGENIRTKKLVAIKCESCSSGIKSIKYETQIYLALNLPYLQVKWFGQHNEHMIMVLPYLGESLNKIKQTYDFSLFQVLELGIKMINHLQFIHEKGFIHRDIKPDNFVMDLEKGEIYLIDFGFCRKYLQADGTHFLINTNKQLIGTPNFVSINIHNKIEPSRRDDLESIGYIMLYLLNTFESFQMTNMNEIISFKMNIEINETEESERRRGEMKILPQIIKRYLIYCHNLLFDDEPDYNYLYELFKS